MRPDSDPAHRAGLGQVLGFLVAHRRMIERWMHKQGPVKNPGEKGSDL